MRQVGQRLGLASGDLGRGLGPRRSPSSAFEGRHLVVAHRLDALTGLVDDRDWPGCGPPRLRLVVDQRRRPRRSSTPSQRQHRPSIFTLRRRSPCARAGYATNFIEGHEDQEERPTFQRISDQTGRIGFRASSSCPPRRSSLPSASSLTYAANVDGRRAPGSGKAIWLRSYRVSLPGQWWLLRRTSGGSKTTKPIRARASVKAMPRNIVVRHHAGGLGLAGHGVIAWPTRSRCRCPVRWRPAVDEAGGDAEAVDELSARTWSVEWARTDNGWTSLSGLRAGAVRAEALGAGNQCSGCMAPPM